MVTAHHSPPWHSRDVKINGDMDGIRYIRDPTVVYSYASIKGAFNIYHDYDDFEYPTDLDFTVRDYGGLNGEVNMIERKNHIRILLGKAPPPGR